MISTLQLAQTGRWHVDRDLFFSGVRTLLDMETGADASTTFVDRSRGANNFGANGNAQVDTAQFKYGSRSALFDGTSDFLSRSDSANIRLDTGDFTLEFWVRFNATTGTRWLLAKETSTNATPWLFYLQSAQINFAGYDSVSALAYQITDAASLSTGVWYHVAGTRFGSTFTLWIDGVSIGTATFAGTLFSSSSDPVVIGATSALANSLDGWIDEVRITAGVARYTSPFGPPSRSFPLR